MDDAMSKANASFLKFPPELLDNVFSHVDPLDLRSLALTCRVFNARFTNPSVLYREIYSKFLDEPPAAELKNWDWIEVMHNFVLIRRVLSSRNYDTVSKKLPFLDAVSNFIFMMARTANPKQSESLNVRFLSEHFVQTDDPANLEAFCCQSVTYTRAMVTSPRHPRAQTLAERRASAKLHTFLGAIIRNLSVGSSSSGSSLGPHTHAHTHRPIYPCAASMVYDLRNYTAGSLWGPFLPDGMATVDWEKMEAIMIVLHHNLREFSMNEGVGLGLQHLWNFIWRGCTPNSYIGKKWRGGSKPQKPLGFEDPYGISGTWMRVVTFLDFHELFHYNFTNPNLPADIHRPPLNTIEAVRLIMMELRATHTSDPEPEDGQDYPVVHFTGTSRSLHVSWDPNANSTIRGTVRQTKEGEIRWTSYSVFNGEERWKSEGIQIGGIRSARGVMGCWFDKEMDPHGPAGPSAFWKISDDIKKRTKLSDLATLSDAHEAPAQETSGGGGGVWEEGEADDSPGISHGMVVSHQVGDEGDEVEDDGSEGQGGTLNVTLIIMHVD